MVTNEHLQSIIDGDIGIIDSTQAVAVARELLAARGCLIHAKAYWGSFSRRAEKEFGADVISERLRASFLEWRKAAE